MISSADPAALFPVVEALPLDDLKSFGVFDLLPGVIQKRLSPTPAPEPIPTYSSEDEQRSEFGTVVPFWDIISFIG